MRSGYDPEQYWNDVAKNIASREDMKIIAGDDEPYYRYKRKKFLQLLDTLDFAGKNVLEIGSGPGGNLGYIYDKGMAKITGADISASMIALAKNNLSGRDIEIVKTNGRELPFGDNSFDMVFTSTVLQHNTNEDDLQKLLSEIARVSKKEICLFERIEKKIKGHESNVGRPVSYYADLLASKNFKLVKTRSLPVHASYYVCGSIRKLFNPTSRKEGQPLSRLSILLENVSLPLTKMLDRIIPGKRGVSLLHFQKGSI